MGPRSGERGRRKGNPVGEVRVELQWGRVRVNAEGALSEGMPCRVSSLQWGRVRVNAEGQRIAAADGLGRAASMGPRSGERGRPTRPCRTSWRPRASMGPRSGERGRAFSHRAGRGLTDASMGPRSGERGRGQYGRRHDRLLHRLQWGRVRVNAEGSQGRWRGRTRASFNGAAFG